MHIGPIEAACCRRPPYQEALIRTLSVSLLAVAAIAASLLIVRQRDERAPGAALLSGGEDLPAQQLEAIRAAGW
jgi:uncharacterized membrane protein